MSESLKLVELDPEVSADAGVVRRLRDLLNDAKAGKLRGIAFAASYVSDSRGSFVTGNVGFQDKIELVGHLAALSHHILCDDD